MLFRSDAHAEGFQSLQEKADEKALLAAGSKVRSIIYNADSAPLREALRPYLQGKQTLAWSTTDPSAELFVSCAAFRDKGLAEVEYTYEGETHRIGAPVACQADLENTGGALAFLLQKRLSHDLIKERFATLHKIGTRLNVTEGVNSCSMIYDSYTSDFSSLRDRKSVV